MKRSALHLFLGAGAAGVWGYAVFLLAAGLFGPADAEYEQSGEISPRAGRSFMRQLPTLPDTISDPFNVPGHLLMPASPPVDPEPTPPPAPEILGEYGTLTLVRLPSGATHVLAEEDTVGGDAWMRDHVDG